jgi:hypothetical protein
MAIYPVERQVSTNVRVPQWLERVFRVDLESFSLAMLWLIFFGHESRRSFGLFMERSEDFLGPVVGVVRASFVFFRECAAQCQ